MARLYANENFPLPVVEELRRLEHDVLTIQEAGKAEQSVPDEEVLAFASIQGRAVLTLNRKHFIRLHRVQPKHARSNRRLALSLGLRLALLFAHSIRTLLLKPNESMQ